MEYQTEQFKIIYTDFKRKVLLEDDIKLLNSINEEIAKVSKTRDIETLVEIETNIVTMGYQLAGIMGRLMAQFNVETDIVEKKRLDRETELTKSGEVKSQTKAASQAKQELHDEIKELSMFESIVEEYKFKIYSLKDVHSAVTHRMMKLDKNI